NETIVRIANNDIGVDHGAPELGDPTGPEDGDIFNTVANRTWTFDSRSDKLSGFSLPDMGIAAVLRNFTPSAANCVVGVYNAAANVCVPVVGDEEVELLAAAGDGYYTMSYTLRDQAGNLTAADPITILVDATGPTFSGAPVFPSTLTGGAAATFGI